MLQYITQGRIKCDTPTGQVFIIQANVLKSLKQFIQLESDSPESGGILIGRTDIETKAKIIESFTSPMEGDCQTRMSFFRSKSHQYALIQAWNESKKFYNLQGLWHTHPEDVPTPSPTDLRDIDTVLNGITNLNDPVLYLIIGRVKTGIWIGRKNFKIKLLGYIELN